MGVIAELQLPAAEFALSETVEAFETLQFEIERIVAHDRSHVMPFVWISGPAFDGLEGALSADDTVEDVRLVSNLEDERLYEMSWVGHVEALIRILVEEEGTVLAAEGNSEGWMLRTLFPEREALSRTYDYCGEHGLSIDIQSIYQLDDGRKGRFGLTDSQQTTLEAAFERGYYEVPRGLTRDELAAELGISGQALSERLRRAHRNLVENTVIIGADDHDGT
ncbi:helix-turn-helix domain-containing protein [Natrononativus amylolyticus]|uniref:helix-turn-helix domain-containing protein n=1 Tax=Natrononativus amylolyticus TaxID=2963434 RepID=UPI0020CC24FA|nr:helix-turn-helix domain-containing protein [Natrononativus amylolyticus]